MSLRVIKAGMLDTVQDHGRFGHQHVGINPTGAMDKFSMETANMLVGNNRSEAVIEMHFPASVFLFTQPALAALSGADFSATINGEPVPIHHPIVVCKNDLLLFQKPLHGTRAYLAVHGSFAINKWLNSFSTNTKAGAGGFKGRALQKDDEILFKNSISTALSQYKILPWQVKLYTEHSKSDDACELHVLPGPEWERLTTESKERLTKESFTISKQSDRMGYRLEGVVLAQNTAEELVSSAVTFGTIQLLPDGSAMILGADHQTTGGYPRIANVISAQHHLFAQLKAGKKVKFKMVDQVTAERLYFEQEEYLGQIAIACNLRLKEFAF